MRRACRAWDLAVLLLVVMPLNGLPLGSASAGQPGRDRHGGADTPGAKSAPPQARAPALPAPCHPPTNPFVAGRLDCLAPACEAIPASCAVRRHPDNAQAWTRLGEAYEDAGQSDSALTAYETAARLAPSAARWTAIGRVALQAHRYDEAIQACRQAAALAPRDLDVLADLTIAYSAVQAWAEALETYQKVRAIDAAVGEELFSVAFRKAK